MNWYNTTKSAGVLGIPWLPEQLRDIEKYVKTGIPFKEIAEYYDVNKGAIIYLNQKYGWRPMRQRSDSKNQIQEDPVDPDNFNKEQKMNWYKITKFAFPRGRVPIKLRRGDIGVLRRLVKEKKTFDEILTIMNSSPGYSISPGILRKLMKEKNIPIPRKVREAEELSPEDIETLRESVNEGETFDELLAWMNSNPNYSISSGLLVKLMKENGIPVPKKIRKKKELSPSNIQALNQLVNEGRTFEELFEYVNPDPDDINISAIKLRELMNKNGIPIPKKVRERKDLDPGDVETLREFENKGKPNGEKFTFEELLSLVNSSPDFNVSTSTLTRIMNENNIPIPKIRPRIEIPDHIQKKIIELNQEKNKSPQDISKHLDKYWGFKIVPKNIYNFLLREEKFRKKVRGPLVFEPTPKQLATIKNLYFSPPVPTTKVMDETGATVDQPIRDIKDIMQMIPGVEKTGYGISNIASELKVPIASLYEWFKTESPKHGIIGRNKNEQLNTIGHRARKSIEKRQRQEQIGFYMGKLLNAPSRKSALGMLGGWRATLGERAEQEGREGYAAMAMYNKHRPFIDEAWFPEDFTSVTSRTVANERLKDLEEVLSRVPWFFDYFKKNHAAKLIEKHRQLIEATVYPDDKPKEKYRSPYTPPFSPDPFKQTVEEIKEKAFYEEVSKEEILRKYKEEEARKQQEMETNNWYNNALLEETMDPKQKALHQLDLGKNIRDVATEFIANMNKQDPNFQNSPLIMSLVSITDPNQMKEFIAGIKI